MLIALSRGNYMTFLERGFSIIEVTVSTAITMMLIIICFSYSTLISLQIRKLILAKTRDRVSNQISLIAGDSRFISFNRSKSPIFDSCFQIFDGRLPCPGQSSIPLAFFDSSGQQISGTNQTPILLDIFGEPCQAHCAIKVYSEVKPQGVPDFGTFDLISVHSASSSSPNDPGNEFIEIAFHIEIIYQDSGSLVPVASRDISVVLDTFDSMEKPYGF